jgi:predicted GIY-YIG superfamily endonuclease
MKDRFDTVIDCVRTKFAELRDSPKYRLAHLPKKIPESGIYLFSDGSRTLYVGRTNGLRKRLQYHTRNNHNQATFAFRLARHETGNLKATYTREGSRRALLMNPKFRFAFDAARKRISQMNVQFIEETDPIKQTILEVFTAFETRAEFNDFNNH